MRKEPQPEQSTVELSIIIPVLDEAERLGPTLDALAELRGAIEVIVVDGGSRDATAKVALSRGVPLLTVERGRGSQMHAGAVQSRGEVIWFLHADTLPPRPRPMSGFSKSCANLR